MQYIVTGYDFTDDGAVQRRLNVRPHHLDFARATKAAGNLIAAVAILNEEGNAVGSIMVLQFETEEELEAWKSNEPYVTQGVWETVDVKPGRVAEL
ncbi:YciI family protein [Mucilaginibacter calamicampi]|uniref:YciI family protein n=1 Tax=Mucilaginibacter calamicampi TaxID=1302352 RepID=A0ABW2YYL7_9SPHI